MAIAEKILLVIMAVLSFSSCGSTPSSDSAVTEGSTAESSAVTERENADSMLELAVNNRNVDVEWENSQTVEALKELASGKPLTVRMSMYGGFEQVGQLGESLPRDDKQTTTSPGDIVLYSGNSIVVFYGSNSWSYTRLGRITGLTDSELTDMLGGGDVTLTLSVTDKG